VERAEVVMHGAHVEEHDAGRARAGAGRPRRNDGGEQSRQGAPLALLRLQQAAGNRAVASMVGGVHRTVQRCGPGSDCDCSPEERAAHAAGAGEPVQRAADDHAHEDDLTG
jgi:hypothetical protein